MSNRKNKRLVEIDFNNKLISVGLRVTQNKLWNFQIQVLEKR